MGYGLVRIRVRVCVRALAVAVYCAPRLHPVCLVSHWFWFAGDGSSYEYLPDVTHIYTDTGYYYVSLIVEGSNGCADTLTKLIHIIGPVQPSNIFSPNGDGINDYFTTISYGIEKINMKIFNRWGGLIFETNNISQGWEKIGERCFQGAEIIIPICNYLNEITKQKNLHMNKLIP